MKRLALLSAAALAVASAFGAEGFYRVEQGASGHWRVIDPDGKETVPLGVCLIRYDGCGNRGGPRRYREWNNAHFPNREAWAEDTVAKLRAWGFNRIGSGDATLRGRGLMYSVGVSFGSRLSGLRQPQEKWICPNPGKPCAAFPNVFHPDFRKWCDEMARKTCLPLKDDRWLFGYYTDNELAWWGRGARDSGLYEAALQLPPGHAARRAAERLAAERGVAPDKAPAAVKLEFLREAAEIYFRETRAAIRAVDPNHMVLGARFAGLSGAHEVVWEVAGKYSDLVTFNLYPWADLDRNAVFLNASPNAQRVTEAFAARYAIVKRPFLITEWSFPALDSGLPCTHGAGQRFRTQAERTQATELFARTMLASPEVVGYDYFMWVDEPPEGVSDVHPEDTNYGLVNERGEPYPIASMFARLHADLPAVIAAGVPKERPAPPPEKGMSSEVIAAQLAMLPVKPEAALRFPEPCPTKGCVLKGVTCAGRPLGDFSIMLSYLVAGKLRWVNIERTVSATKGADGKWTVVAEGRLGKHRFEFTLELTFFKDAPFFLADVVRLRNTGTEPLDVQGVYFRAVSPFARESDGKTGVRNLWKPPKKARWQAADGRWFGVRSKAATANRFVFRYDKARGSQHPDAIFCPPEPLTLGPGAAYEPKGTMWAVVEGGVEPVPSFNLATFNVRFATPKDAGELNWEKRVPRMAEIVRRHGFDLFGVQEGSSNIVAGLERELPGFAHVGPVTSKTAEGVGIFYRTDRFKALETDVYWLSDTPDEPGSVPLNPAWRESAKWMRDATSVLFEDLRTGKRFRYVNTHLNHRGPRAMRRFEMDVVMRRSVEPAKAQGVPVILTGDMNCPFPNADTPEALRAVTKEEIAEMAADNPIARARVALDDAYLATELSPEGPFFTLTSFKPRPICRIDYVLVSPDVKVNRYVAIDDKVEGQPPSDHYPVMATLTLP